MSNLSIYTSESSQGEIRAVTFQSRHLTGSGDLTTISGKQQPSPPHCTAHVSCLSKYRANVAWKNGWFIRQKECLEFNDFFGECGVESREYWPRHWDWAGSDSSPAIWCLELPVRNIFVNKLMRISPEILCQVCVVIKFINCASSVAYTDPVRKMVGIAQHLISVRYRFGPTEDW